MPTSTPRSYLIDMDGVLVHGPRPIMVGDNMATDIIGGVQPTHVVGSVADLPLAAR